MKFLVRHTQECLQLIDYSEENGVVSIGQSRGP